MNCPRCFVESGVEILLGTPALLPGSRIAVKTPDDVCPRCCTKWSLDRGEPIGRMVWEPVFGWISREEFDRLVPRMSASRGGIHYEYGGAADERRAVRAWARGLLDGARPSVVFGLIVHWVAATPEFRAKAFR